MSSYPKGLALGHQVTLTHEGLLYRGALVTADTYTFTAVPHTHANKCRVRIEGYVGKVKVFHATVRTQDYDDALSLARRANTLTTEIIRKRKEDERNADN